MNIFEQIKLTAQAGKLLSALAGKPGFIEEIKLLGELKQILAKLGDGVQTEEAEPEVSETLPELVLPENATPKDRGLTVNAWVKENLQGRVITASNGAKIHFNRSQSTEHLAHDGRRSQLAAKAVGKIAAVFEKGKFLGREELNKVRPKADFVAFHCYQKWEEIDGYRLLLLAKAGERDNGTLETLPDLIAYTQRIIEKENQPSIPNDENIVLDGFRELSAGTGNHTATFDKMQVAVAEEATLTILQILDPQGNDVTVTLGEAEQETMPVSDGMESVKHLYAFSDNKTKAQRQQDNNAVFDLLDKVERGELQPEEITPEQKAVLAKYSGSGGGLKSRDGKTGSAHEYYTPAPVAEAMWRVIEEMGFSGGKVLDPCGGSGIFGAFAPQSAVVHAVEMDETSAKVNELVNGSERYHVSVASFEEAAQSIPDHSVDAIVTNVPFGDVSLRKHRNKDSKFRKENLQTYFVLRSLDKLRYGGLAAFIVPSSFLDGKGGKAANARVLTSQVAEFVGAYRLPNSIFGTAGADVATDILFYRKYNQDTAEKIAELQAQNPDVLQQANVMWPPYLDGKYFKLAENKKYILGEEGTTKNRFSDSAYAVINHDSVANIAQAVKRFGGSRIDRALLDVAETDPQTYKPGDTVYQNGQAYVFDGVRFQAVAASEGETAAQTDEIMGRLDNPLRSFEHGVTAKEALAAVDYYRQTNQQAYIPIWAAKLAAAVSRLPENVQEKQFRRVLVGLSVQYVMDYAQAGENQLEQHPQLSEAMKERTALDKSLSAYRQANAAIRLHYSSKNGYSAAWLGEVKETHLELSQAKQVEQIQYLNGTLALPSEKVRALGIDPLADDDWCVNADGTEAMKADDYFVGNLQECLDKIDADFQTASDEAIRNKLLRMKQLARERAPALPVERMRFSMRSPFVDTGLLLRFVESKLQDSELKARIEQENGKYYVSIDGNTKTDHDKVLKRIGAYLKSGTISHQGAELHILGADGRYREMSSGEKLKHIREEITAWNAEFDTWLKADKGFMAQIKAKAADPKHISFPKTDDESEVEIAGASGAFRLHGYQNSFVRKSAREFSGINAFGVGLGKTATALAAVQYALETGTKKKTCFIVPNAVLSNWHKESSRYYSESERENCLFIGADTDKNGDFTVNSANYARDLNEVLSNRHNKIFMTQQAFEKIRLREETAQAYIDFMKQADRSFAESQNAAKNEQAEAKAANLAADIAGKNKLDNAPYFEDLGIDAIVVDEAHHFKNAKQAMKVAQVKGLPSGSPSNRAIDMSVKSWLVRKGNPRQDGVMLLTATPVTNSPLEIYAMLSLAVGEERVQQAFLGDIKGADDFIEAICEIQSREETNMVGEEVPVQALAGIKNLTLVQNLIRSNADIKEAKDVGVSFKQVDSNEVSDGIVLDATTRRVLEKYKNAYRIARLKLKDLPVGHETAETLADFESVLREAGTVERVGHPFSMVNRMSKALLDLELTQDDTRYSVDDEAAAQTAVDTFNGKAKITFETETEPEDEDLIVKRKQKDNGDGIKITVYTVRAQARLEDGVVILNCQDFQAQLRLEALLNKHQAGVRVNISPKTAALLENVKKEQAHIRYVAPDGSKPQFAKQIVFVESLAMHTKIKRIIVQNGGIPDSRITFVSGQFNSDPDEIIEVQERFNGNEGNGYSMVIANKKAEVGINLQKGCQAIHHLELNWTPDSITQRNGRGVRQGNTADNVNIYYYEADGTFDSYKRTAINRKSNWIESVMGQTENSDGFAHVGQELTAQDYDEMINFDGSAAQFDAMMKRQNERKQAETDRQTLQAQNVNIGILRKARSWLDSNPDKQHFIERELKAAEEAYETYRKAHQTWVRSEEKGNKSAEKNRAIMERLLAEMRRLTADFAGIEWKGRPLMAEGGTIGREEWAKMPDFRIGSTIAGYGSGAQYLRTADDVVFPDDNPLAVRYGQEYDRQLALCEAAKQNAKTAFGTAGAMPEFAVEMLAQGKEPIYAQKTGEYFESGTIVVGKDITALLMAQDRVLYLYNGQSVLSARYCDELDKDGTRIYRPNQSGFSDGLKALAAWQSKAVLENGLTESGKIKHYGSDMPAPSEFLPEVLDYLDEAAKQVKPEVRIKLSSVLPAPYFPRILSDKPDGFDKLYQAQAAILNFDGLRHYESTVALKSEASDWAEKINLDAVYRWQDGWAFVQNSRLSVPNLEALHSLLQVKGHIGSWLENLLNAEYLADYAESRTAYEAAVKTSETLEQARAHYIGFLQRLFAGLGLETHDFAEAAAFIDAQVRTDFKAWSEHASHPFCLVLSGNTWGLNQADLANNGTTGIRSFAKYLGHGDKVAWVNKSGQTNGESDTAFYAASGLNGLSNVWLVAPEVWTAVQEAASPSVLNGVEVREIFV